MNPQQIKEAAESYAKKRHKWGIVQLEVANAFTDGYLMAVEEYKKSEEFKKLENEAWMYRDLCK